MDPLKWSTSTDLLSPLMKRGAEFLGSRYPILCGAMTWVSEPKLVSAVCNNGCFGCIAGGNAPTEILAAQIEETRRLTKNNFGVNLITIAPSYQNHLAMLKDARVPYIIFAGSFPKEKEVAEAKATGAKVLCFASTISIAERMIRFGADAIILEGSEAGGHIGHVSSMILIQQLLFKYAEQVPIFVAGGVATGKMMAHLLMMGASGVQLGTRFVMTEECSVHPRFKEVFLKANARDAIATPQYDSKLPVVAVRALKNKGMQEFGALQLRLLRELESGKIHRQEAQEEVERFWVGALRRAAVDGDVDGGSLMAGQAVGLMDKIMPISDLVCELLDDANSALLEIKNKLG
ncbi:MAG: nitronate monooxygenase [Lentisphaeria bacterium]|nr:nitronate monooxygenase [Lentisphaeria bacterium]MBR2911468.1 nitronate monooxygenase [Lentisphaeria bacterium]